jgi:ferredoxin-like protein FixX
MEYHDLVANLFAPSTKTWHIAVFVICVLAACQVYYYLSSIHVSIKQKTCIACQLSELFGDRSTCPQWVYLREFLAHGKVLLLGI